MCLKLASSYCRHASSAFRLLKCSSQLVSLRLVVLYFSDSLKISFIILSVLSSISRAFSISWSQFLVTLSLSSVIDFSQHDYWSTLNCTLSPSSSGSSGSLSV